MRWSACARTVSLLTVIVTFVAFPAQGSTYRLDECDEGGPGDTHCSLESGEENCGVTCAAEGYYACCSAHPELSCDCISVE